MINAYHHAFAARQLQDLCIFLRKIKPGSKHPAFAFPAGKFYQLHQVFKPDHWLTATEMKLQYSLFLKEINCFKKSVFGKNLFLVQVIPFKTMLATHGAFAGDGQEYKR